MVERLKDQAGLMEYGSLSYDGSAYPLLAIQTQPWRANRPAALVTGGVHGYETSGVLGAIEFIESHWASYSSRFNLLIAPCISPWAYERVHRWNRNAIDPNRSFFANTAVEEAAALQRLIAPIRDQFVMHVDLHETTDSDESEFRPQLAARDGKTYVPDSIPDGFYLVGDSENPQPAFQQAIITAVSLVTHIAPADAKGKIIGSPVAAPGLINYPVRQLGLCAGITQARYTTTTEVYPDSPRTTAQQCISAQVTAVRAALDFVLTHL